METALTDSRVVNVETDVSAFATVRAELELESGRAELLRSLDLDESEWLEVERAWLGRLTEETERGSVELAEKYVLAHRARTAELVASSGGPDASSTAPAPAVPSAHAAKPSTTVAGIDAGMMETGTLDLLALGVAALPFRDGVAGEPPPRSADPAPRPVPGSGETGEVTIVPRSGALPFDSDLAVAAAPGGAPGTDAAPSQPAVRPLPRRLATPPVAGAPAADASVDETGALSLADLWDRGDPLPFEAANGAPKAPPAPPAPAEPAPRPPVPPAGSAGSAGSTAPRPASAPLLGGDIHETATVDLAEIWGKGDALPFRGSASAPPPTRVPQSVQLAQSAQSAATSELDRTAPAGIVLKIDDAPPFSAGAERPPVDLTVEQYASLCALCAAYPDHAGASNVRFGVHDGAARDRLDRYWQSRFDGEPEVRAAWQTRLQAYRAWLESERAGRGR